MFRPFCFFLLSAVLLLSAGGILPAYGQDHQTYPTNWWTNMRYNHIQIMVHGKDIGKADGYSVVYPGVVLERISRTENPNYVFLNLQITDSADAGTMQIQVSKGKRNIAIPFELKERRTGNGTDFAMGVTSKDLVYLIMPDRFSNGDPSNDRIPGMRDQSLNRDTVYNRHGGDLKGVEQHLDYLRSLGVTAVWLNPVLENDMPERTEHGYAITNHYKVDPRLGGNQAYKSLVDAAHARGIKIIQDAVYNHVGSYHFTVLDPPMHDWLHQWDGYQGTSSKQQSVFDPYGSRIDKRIMQQGWFVPVMPDMNQSNPFVEKYLIQHAIWTVEEFGIDGWRIDTYAYSNLDFMNKCNEALLDEYPQLTMFGETWVNSVAAQAFLARNKIDLPFKSNLPGVTDFQLLGAITETVTDDFSWTTGANKLYDVLASDFLYEDPMTNVVFVDNHDLSRFYSVIRKDFLKYKLALTWLYTTRGIPQIYYGAEIGMEGLTSPNDGHVRKGFPGGWKGDAPNKFMPAGRTATEDSIFNLFASLGRFRERSTAITTGKLMQYAPIHGEYIYFRYDDRQTIMVAMNTGRETRVVDPAYYKERTAGFTRKKDIVTGDITPLRPFEMKQWESGAWELLP